MSRSTLPHGSVAVTEIAQIRPSADLLRLARTLTPTNWPCYGFVDLKVISREDLKRKLDEGEDLKLVFVLGEMAYRAMHIPGSVHVDTPDKAAELLEKDDQIVVYCTNENCRASRYAYDLFVQHGYKNVRRYAGGLEEWEEAGYPLVGEMAPRPE